MFAAWIPEALDKIDALMLQDPPPGPLAHTRARREVVNIDDEYPMPAISTWLRRDRVGIRISWTRCTILIDPCGGVMHFR